MLHVDCCEGRNKNTAITNVWVNKDLQSLSVSGISRKEKKYMKKGKDKKVNCCCCNADPDDI